MQTAYFPYFLELAKTLSFSKAAKNLCISQSGLSRAIQSIEQEIGCSLFLRRGSSVYITKEGERFVEYAKEITEALEKINRLSSSAETDYLCTKDEGEQVYCDATSTSFAVLTAIRKRKSAKLQELCYRELSPELILRKLELQKPEDPWLFFVSIPEEGRFAKRIAQTSNIGFEPLLRIHAMAKVPSSSVFSSKTFLSPGDLAHIPWAVSNDPNIVDTLIAATGMKNIKKNILLRSSRRDYIDQEILNNNCIGLTNNYAKDALSPRFAAVPFQRDAVSIIGLLFRNDLKPPQETEQLHRKIAIACSKLKQLPW